MGQGFVDTRHSCIAYYEKSVGKNNVALLADCEHFPMIDDSVLFVGEVTRLLDQVAK